ncbi:MAG: hypothetical protein EA421_09570 [Gemmatimonadales bacterium]|nr:MAG: hypothetical protein EA421_09570 [Gemmatimonadales bacterium]
MGRPGTRSEERVRELEAAGVLGRLLLRVPVLLFLLGLAAVGCTRVGAPLPPPPPADLPPAYSPGDRAPAPPPPEARPTPEGPSREDPTREAPPRVREEPARSVPPLEGVGEMGIRLPQGEVRALWVVRTALLHPDSARAAVHRAHLAGFNTLLVQVRGRGDAYYQSRWEPRAETLSRQPLDYDPLAVVLEEAHGLGLQVHAWVNTHVVASSLIPPTDPGHLALSRPELLAVPRALAPRLHRMEPRDPAYLRTLLEWTRFQGTQVEGLYTNPGHPGVQDHMVAVVADLLERYPVDGLHLDYIRYPSPEFDYSRASLEGFEAWLRARGADSQRLRRGGEALRARDPLLLPDLFPGEWGDYRRERVTELMARLRHEARIHRPEAVVSAAVFANADDARNGRFQEWESWLRNGIVDVVAPMAYTASDATWNLQIQRAAEAGDPRRVWAGVGVYQNSFAGAVSKGRRAGQLGVGGVVLFSYDWAVGPEGLQAARGSYLDRYAREVWGGAVLSGW